ncbi:BQ2448_4522 [Microbotryum intermedium]|uniref:BQ2448_4522 protein n=1 Tax=Microbotryum intermedium TaxID=269621 RepID=A0A238FKX0_9BASI|nr:BQ2448_4522 [Microbotryum intermedium]
MSHDLHHNKRFLIHRRALPVLSDGAVVQGATPAVELTAPTFAPDSGIVVASVVDSSSVVFGGVNSVASTTTSTTTTTTAFVASASATDGTFATSIIQDDPSVTSAPVMTPSAAPASSFSAGPALMASSQDSPGGLSTAARDGLIAAAAAIGLVLMAWVIYRGCRRRRARAALTASITSDSSSSLDGYSEKPRQALFLSPPSKAKTRDFKSSFDNYTATSPGLTTPAGWATFSTTSIPGTINAGTGALPAFPQVQSSRWSASTFGDARIPVRPATPSTPPPRSPPRSPPTTPKMGRAMMINPFDDRHIPSTPSPTSSSKGNSIKRKSPQMLSEIRLSVSDPESEEGDMGFMGTVFRPDYAMGRTTAVEGSKETQEVLESPKSTSRVTAGTPTVLRVYNKGDVSDDE